MYRVRRVIELTGCVCWAENLTPSFVQQWLPISLDSERQVIHIRPFQVFFFYIRQPSLIDSLEILCWPYFFIGSCYHHNRFILRWVLKSLDSRYRVTQSIHKLDSGQRRDLRWCSATCHPLILDVFVQFFENLISSTRPTHPSPSYFSTQVDLFQHRVTRSVDSQSHQIYHIHPFLSCSASSSYLYTASIEAPGWFQSVSAYVHRLIWLYCVFVLLFENSTSSSYQLQPRVK